MDQDGFFTKVSFDTSRKKLQFNLFIRHNKESDRTVSLWHFKEVTVWDTCRSRRSRIQNMKTGSALYRSYA